MSKIIFPVVIYFSILAMASLACFLAYGLDKRRAVNGGLRVPERTLHVLALIGGWPGAMLAQRRFRHKTKKFSFQFTFWLVVSLHIAIVASAAYALFGLSF